MLREQLIRIASEDVICSSLQLSKLASGVHHQYEQKLGKVGQCHVDSMWIAGVLPHGSSMPKAALIYAKAHNVFHQGQKLPDWERLALVRRSKSCNDLLFSTPIDCLENPLSGLLKALDLYNRQESSKANSPLDILFVSSDKSTGIELYIGSDMLLQPLFEARLLDLFEQFADQHTEIGENIEHWKALIP